MSKELLPCPFCGSPPCSDDPDCSSMREYMTAPSEQDVSIICANIHCTFGINITVPDKKLDSNLYEQILMKAWNSRHIPDDMVMVPREPTEGLLVSMAMRYRHDFGVLDSGMQHSILIDMRKLHEEVVGEGFYRFEREAEYKAMLEDTDNE